MKDSEDYRVINTKVSPDSYERLRRLAAKKKTTVYQLVQMVCDTLIRYMDDRHNLTPEMEQAMSVFEHMEGWKDSLSLTEPNSHAEISEATYYFTDTTGKKKGARAVHVSIPFFSQWTQCENIQTILERTLCLLMPHRYMRLRSLAVDMDCSSILELIDTLIVHHAKEADVAFIRSQFEDADRSDFGEKPKADGPYKRKPTQSLLNFEENQKKKSYGEKADEYLADLERRAQEEKNEESRRWLNDNMEGKPHGYDW